MLTLVNLGYTGEANVTEWPKTVQKKLVTKYPKIKQVIPRPLIIGKLILDISKRRLNF